MGMYIIIFIHIYIHNVNIICVPVHISIMCRSTYMYTSRFQLTTQIMPNKKHVQTWQVMP